MKSGCRHCAILPSVKSFIAVLISLALIVHTPGLGINQVLAQTSGRSIGAARSVSGGENAVGVTRLDSSAVNINPANSAEKLPSDNLGGEVSGLVATNAEGNLVKDAAAAISAAMLLPTAAIETPTQEAETSVAPAVAEAAQSEGPIAAFASRLFGHASSGSGEGTSSATGSLSAGRRAAARVKSGDDNGSGLANLFDAEGSGRALKIGHFASEFGPAFTTGGLGNAIANLTFEQAAQGHKVDVLMPGYSGVVEKLRKGTSLKQVNGEIRLPLEGEKGDPAAILRADINGINLHVIEQKVFKRPDIYATGSGGIGSQDVMAFFSRIAVEAAEVIGRYDGFMTHDWQAGLVPSFLELNDVLKGTPTVAVGHNLAHSGLVREDDVRELGLDPLKIPVVDPALRSHGFLSMLNAGLLQARKIILVSEGYAKEIVPKHPVLSKREQDVHGIPWGIDTKKWNPATDRLIPYNYDERHAAGGKRQNKLAFQEFTAQARKADGLPGLKRDPNAPVLLLGSRIAEQKGFQLVEPLLQHLIDAGAQIVILGSASPGDVDFVELEKRLAAFAVENPTKVFVHPFVDSNLPSGYNLLHWAYAAADALIHPSIFEPGGLIPLEGMRYGALPILSPVGGHHDSVVDVREYPRVHPRKGYGFVMESVTAEGLRAAIARFLVTFWDSDKRMIGEYIHNVMTRDFSMGPTVVGYERVLRAAMSQRHAQPVLHAKSAGGLDLSAYEPWMQSTDPSVEWQNPYVAGKTLWQRLAATRRLKEVRQFMDGGAPGMEPFVFRIPHDGRVMARSTGIEGYWYRRQELKRRFGESRLLAHLDDDFDYLEAQSRRLAFSQRFSERVSALRAQPIDPLTKARALDDMVLEEIRDRRKEIRELDKASWLREAIVYMVLARAQPLMPGKNFFQSLNEEWLHQLQATSGANTIFLGDIYELGKINAWGAIGSPFGRRDYRINPDRGSEEDFVDFIDRAHAAGYRVGLDEIPNHTSVDAPFVKEHPEGVIHIVLPQEMPNDQIMAGVPRDGRGRPLYYLIETDNYPENGRKVHKKILVAHPRADDGDVYTDNAQRDLSQPVTREHEIQQVTRLASMGVDLFRRDMADELVNGRYFKRWHSFLERDRDLRTTPEWMRTAFSATIEDFERRWKELGDAEFFAELDNAVRKVRPDVAFIDETFTTTDKLSRVGSSGIYNKASHNEEMGQVGLYDALQLKRDDNDHTRFHPADPNQIRRALENVAFRSWQMGGATLVNFPETHDYYAPNVFDHFGRRYRAAMAALTSATPVLINNGVPQGVGQDALLGKNDPEVLRQSKDTAKPVPFDIPVVLDPDAVNAQNQAFYQRLMAFNKEAVGGVMSVPHPAQGQSSIVVSVIGKTDPHNGSQKAFIRAENWSPRGTRASFNLSEPILAPFGAFEPKPGKRYRFIDHAAAGRPNIHEYDGETLLNKGLPVELDAYGVSLLEVQELDGNSPTLH